MVSSSDKTNRETWFLFFLWQKPVMLVENIHLSWGPLRGNTSRGVSKTESRNDPEWRTRTCLRGSSVASARPHLTSPNPDRGPCTISASLRPLPEAPLQGAPTLFYFSVFMMEMSWSKNYNNNSYCCHGCSWILNIYVSGSRLDALDTLSLTLHTNLEMEIIIHISQR